MAFNFNDQAVERLFINDTLVNKLYLNDELVWETPPLITGDYIYYSLDPDTGFITAPDMRRLVNDEGNTIMVGANGMYNGYMYTGRGIQLGETQELNIPVPTYDGDPYIHVNDIHQLRIDVQGLGIVPGNRYDIDIYIEELLSSYNPDRMTVFSTRENSEGWSCTILSEANDVNTNDAFNLLNQGTSFPYGGTGRMPLSNIVQKRVNFYVEILDETYADVYGVVAPTLDDPWVEDPDNVDNYLWLASKMLNEEKAHALVFGFTINGEVFDVAGAYGTDTITGDSGNTATIYGFTSDAWGTAKATDYHIVYYDYETKTHIQHNNVYPLTGNYIFYYQNIGHIAVLNSGIQLTPEDLTLLDDNPEALTRLALGDTSTGLSIAPTDIYEYYPLFEASGATVYGINGTTTDISNYDEAIRQTTNFGPQTARFELLPEGLPFDFITKRHILLGYYGKEYIDTGVIIDGSADHFSMMMAFSYPHTSGSIQIVAGTSGIDGIDNKIQAKFYEDNSLEVIIGKTIYDATPFIDPDQPVHAMIVIYDASTGEVTGAADGGTLMSFGQAVFDGPTLSTVWLGNEPQLTLPFDGYIGEGILTVDLLDQAAWDEFWNRVSEPIIDTITVGENGYMSGYSKDNWGALSNPYFAGDEIRSVMSNYSTNVVQMSFVSGGKVMEAGKLDLHIADRSVTLTWSDSEVRYQVTNASFADWLKSQRGNTLSFEVIMDTISPCMTAQDAPYGWVEATYRYNDSYPAWKGMNCSAVNGGDSWVTPLWEQDDPDLPDIEGGDISHGWWLTDDDMNSGMGMMMPTKLSITPRAGMATGWYSDNNPWRLRIVGINGDMTEEVLIDNWFDDTWNDGGLREIDLTGLATSPKRGLKVYILGTRKYENGGSFHSGWAWIKYEGEYYTDTAPEARNVTVVGDPIVDNTVEVQYSYYDYEGDSESGTTYQWYRRLPEDESPTPISGATAVTYTIIADDLGYLLSAEVTPANVNGTGTAVISDETTEVTNP